MYNKVGNTRPRHVFFKLVWHVCKIIWETDPLTSQEFCNSLSHFVSRSKFYANKGRCCCCCCCCGRPRLFRPFRSPRVFARDFAHRCHGLRWQSALGKASLGILCPRLSLRWACDLCLGKIYPEALTEIFIQKAWACFWRPCKHREKRATSDWLHSWDCQ